MFLLYWLLAAQLFAGPGVFFLEDNVLHLEDDVLALESNIDEATFHRLIDETMALYKDLAAEQGAILIAGHHWENSLVNAYANQIGQRWLIEVFGGFARRPDMNPDSFVLMLCHELGHHFAGYPFYDGRWSASEGQADYFATLHCVRKLWKNQVAENMSYRDKAPAEVRRSCDQVWQDTGDQDICYRSVLAGIALASVASKTGGEPAPALGRASKVVRSQTLKNHPPAQCRLDTYISGSLCAESEEWREIPGKGLVAGQGSRAAETIADRYSCTRSDESLLGRRPRCWFAPQRSLRLSLDHDRFIDADGNFHDDGAIAGKTLIWQMPIYNGFIEAIENVKVWFNTNDTQIEFVQSTADYRTVINDRVAQPIQSPVVRFSSDLTCGSQVEILADIQGRSWIDRQKLEVVVGRKLELDSIRQKVDAIIPDNREAGLQSAVIATTDRAVYQVVIKAMLDHPDPGSVYFILQEPSGNQSFLGLSSSRFFEKQLWLDEPSSGGEWVLEAVDFRAGIRGHLVSWDIQFIGYDCKKK